jgi:nitrite reductase/ring-hydroxylating ferredoxin subunit/alkylhydroperoxidase/carboxymuconolactone decarboxylase family protein YurZ
MAAKACYNRRLAPTLHSFDMSDALAFLVKARPEAMGHYLAFLKDCGTRLDPRTRCLISVITKVHAQTERGLRQYVKRALREGCSMAEVLDALLMAFPALGLSRIVWAVDVLLDMDLPELQALVAQAAQGAQGAGEAQGADGAAPGGGRKRPAAPVPMSAPAGVAKTSATTAPAPAPPASSARRWHDVMAAADLQAGQIVRIDCDGRSVFVRRAGRSVHVFDSRCPHQDTDIPHLALQGAMLTCPKHGWMFDLTTGQGVQPGTRPLTEWPAKVQKGRVLASW